MPRMMLIVVLQYHKPLVISLHIQNKGAQNHCHSSGIHVPCICCGHKIKTDKGYVIVIAQLPGIYVAINLWQLGNKCYISHLIGPQCGARVFFHSNSNSKQTMQQRNRRDPRLLSVLYRSGFDYHRLTMTSLQQLTRLP